MADAKGTNNGSADDSAPLLSSEAERQQLLEEISRIRTRLLQVQSSIGIHRFSEFELDEYSSSDSSSSDDDSEAGDFETEVEEELFQLAGVRCTKFEEECVFELSAGNSADNDTVYWIQILNNGDSGMLGNFYMPIGLNINKILKLYPIEDFRKVRRFLRACKRYLHCYSARERQCHKMKEILSSATNCSCEWSLSFTHVWISMYGVKLLETAEAYDVTFCMRYRLNETLPYKCYTDIDSDNVPDGMKELFRLYYKNFKETWLQDAFDEIVGNPSGTFSWTKIEKLGPISELNVSNILQIDSSGSGNELSLLLHRNKNGERTGRKAVKDKMRDERSANIDDSAPLEITERNQTTRPKRMKQSTLTSALKGKKHKVREQSATVNDNRNIGHNKSRNLKNGIEKEPTKKCLDSTADNLVTEIHEEIQPVNVEDKNLKQLEKASKTFKGIEVSRELNEKKGNQAENDTNQEESADTLANEKDDADRKYNVQNNEVETNRSQFYKGKAILDGQFKKQRQSKAKDRSNEENDNLDASQFDADKDLPQGEHESLCPKHCVPEKICRERRIMNKIDSARRVISYLDELEKSEIFTQSTDTNEVDDHPSTNEVGENLKKKVFKKRRKDSSSRRSLPPLTPSSSVGTDSRCMKDTIKNRQEVKGKTLSLTEEIGTRTQELVEPIEIVERNESDRKGHLLAGTPEYVNPSNFNILNLHSSTPLSLSDIQSLTQKRTKIAERKFRRLEQIRKENAVNIDVVNSTPISGNVVNEVNILEIAEISEIGESHKNLREEHSLEQHPKGQSPEIQERYDAVLERSLGEHEEPNPIDGQKKNNNIAAEKMKIKIKLKAKKCKILKQPESLKRHHSNDEEMDIINRKNKNSCSNNKLEKVRTDNVKRRKTSYKSEETEYCPEVVLDEGVCKNHSLHKGKDERGKSGERGTIRKKKETGGAHGREEIELSAGSDNVKQRKHKKSMKEDTNSREKSLKRHRVRKVLKIDAKKRKLSMSNEETEYPENDVVPNVQDGMDKPVERARLRHSELDANKGKTSRKLRNSPDEKKAEGDGRNGILMNATQNGGKKLHEDEERKEETVYRRGERKCLENDIGSLNHGKNKKFKSVERKKAKKLIKGEAKKGKIVYGQEKALFSGESDISKKEDGNLFNDYSNQSCSRSIERNKRLPGKTKVDENRENNLPCRDQRAGRKYIGRSKLGGKVIGIQNKGNVKDNSSEIVATDSSDDYQSNEDIFNNSELLRDLAHIKEVGELKPTTAKRKKNLGKKVKK